jgi:hypothetical protein
VFVPATFSGQFNTCSYCQKPFLKFGLALVSLKKLAKDKHSSLFCSSVSKEEKKNSFMTLKIGEHNQPLDRGTQQQMDQ